MNKRHLIISMLCAALSIASGPSAAEKTPASDQVMTVYKSPTCGCCVAWVDHLKENGFKVEAIDRTDMGVLKQELGVAPGMGSCHTAKIAGYTIEGHVPAGDIHRLLAEKPNATGLAVPGMPIGSPGMEMGDRRDRYKVFLFGPDGAKTWAQH